MAQILKKLRNGNVLEEDFKLWLISDSSESCNEKADFIPYFLNYVKENCTWLISKEIKCAEASVKLKTGEKSTINTNNTSQSFNQTISRVSSELSENQKCDRGEVDARFFNNNKYSKIKDDSKLRNTKAVSTIPVENYKEQVKILHAERNFQKTHYYAKKSLNFQSVSGTKTVTSNRQNRQAFDENIKSLEAFPPLDAKSNDTRPRDAKNRRRITPTPVKAINKGSSKFGSSNFITPPEKISNEVFQRTPYVENPASNLQNEREMLKMHRNKYSQSTAVSNSFNDSKVDCISPKKPTSFQYIIPDPEKVSHREVLAMFSSIYATLINHALVPNVTSELYFVFELLTSKISSEQKLIDKNNVFCSVHNCTFFGVSALVKLQNLLNLLDKNTLFSLCEIPFLSKFSSELITLLQNYCKEKQDGFTRLQSLNRVPFLLEEDTKENFVDSHAFTSFRKQRDLFYELLRDWQQQPLNCIDVKFQEHFSRKAKLLINLGPNVVNMHHLAKLFQKQMIASCLGLEVNEVYDELLSDIQRNFPGKFEKLRERFMMPFCVGEPNPPPTFYGIQAFFSELVLAASSAVLNQQLQDIFVCKILDFNNADIFSDEELSSLGSVKEKYIFVLHTLRLLGKFLGFLYYLPYKITEPLPVSIISNQINSRKYSIPPLDILTLIKTAVENNRVILTVPWIVEYLSMIDPVAKNLPYVEETLKILVAIYRGQYIFSNNSLNFWFLRLIIGWLFDVLNYPYEYSCLLQPITFEKTVKCEGLDFLAIIDKQLVHSCCPYLIEFKVLVHSFLTGMKNQNNREIRKITPVTTTKPRLPTSLSKQQIETQLEENFFFLHPPSLKKTVEFVSERVASKVINRIRSEVTEFKLHCIEYITSQETYKEMLGSKPPNENKLKSFIDSCFFKLYEKSHSKIADFINVKCHEDINHIMAYLLPDDVKSPVLKMSCDISFRQAIDKITNWCDANLILLDIQKDIQNKLNHLSKSDGDIISDTDFCISSIISSMQKLISKIYSGPFDIQPDHLKMLSEVPSILKKEIGNSAKKLIFFLTVDLYIALITYCPKSCDNPYNISFIEIWSECPKCYDLETYFIGVQNIKFLISGENFELSNEKLIFIISNLLDKGIFDPDKLKIYVTKLNSFQWKDVKCLKILNCLCNVLKLPNIEAVH